MSRNVITAEFRNLDIFRGLDDEQLHCLARQAERVIYKPDQIIVKAGETGDAAIFIVAGRAKALVSSSTRLDPIDVAPGSILGETAMLTEHTYRATVVATTQVRALKITRAAVAEEMLIDRSLAEHFTARLSSRIWKISLEMRRLDQMLLLAEQSLSLPARPSLPKVQNVEVFLH